MSPRWRCLWRAVFSIIGRLFETRVWPSGRAVAFQATYMGSTPVTRSKSCLFNNCRFRRRCAFLFKQFADRNHDLARAEYAVDQ